MDHQRIPQQALYWQVPGYKRGPGRPRANWRSVVSKDLQKMGFTWEEAEVAALDRHEWRRSVAQCVLLEGWTKCPFQRCVDYVDCWAFKVYNQNTVQGENCDLQHHDKIS